MDLRRRSPFALLCLAIASGAASAQTNWTQSTSTPQPPARALASMFYDASQQAFVLFGGSSPTGQVRGDLWLWSANAWTRLQQPRPSARWGAGVATGPNTILFGGTRTNTDFGDTWQWGAAGWTQLAPANAPPARSRHAMAWDPVGQRAVLHGGIGGGAVLGDTWTYDAAANTWTQLPGPGPGPVSGAAMAWDRTADRLVMHGGFDDAGEPMGTWVLEGDTWREFLGWGPRAHSGMSMCSGPEGIVFYGGASYTGRTTILDETWVFDRSGWYLESAAGPGARYLHAMAVDPMTGRGLMFSGHQLGQETWTYAPTEIALFEAYGSACAGRFGEPVLRVSGGLAVPGQTYQLTGENLGVGTLALLGLGFDRTQSNGVPLPLSLASLGAPGCELLVDVQSVYVLNAVGGVASWSTVVPGSNSLIGTEFFTQVGVLDPTPGPGAVAVSQGIRARIGFAGPGERPRTVTFTDSLGLDLRATNAEWGANGLIPGTIASSGRLGYFDYTLGTPLGNNEWQIDTSSFVVPADRSLTGQVEKVTDGVFEFTEFYVPPGVTVRFTGPHPARLYVRGYIEIDGRLDGSAVDQEVFAAGSQSAGPLRGQQGSLGGPGGGRGGDGGDRGDGTGTATRVDGSPGQDVRLIAGHAYAAFATGTGGRGSIAWPPWGLSSNVTFSAGGLSLQIGAGGGGGGFARSGSNSAFAGPFPAGQTSADRGPVTAGGAAFVFPPGTLSGELFAIGGSGGGGGGSHSYLGTNGQPFDIWRAGAGGAGGGGVIVARAGQDIRLGFAASIAVDGGDGADFVPATLATLPAAQRFYAQPGGGGSGGSVLLQAGARVLSYGGTLSSLGGQGGQVSGVRPFSAATNAFAGNGSPGSIRVETRAGRAVPINATPPATFGRLRNVPGPTGARSQWIGQPINGGSLLRYEMVAVVNGTRVLFSDDPAISPRRADDPNDPVQIRFQGADLIVGGTNLGTWRDAVNARDGSPSVARDGATSVRFDVTLRPSLDPTVRVESVSIVFR